MNSYARGGREKSGAGGLVTMLKLEDLQLDAHVAGIEPSMPVKLLCSKKAAEVSEALEREAQDVLKCGVDRKSNALSKSLLPRRPCEVGAPRQAWLRQAAGGRTRPPQAYDDHREPLRTALVPTEMAGAEGVEPRAATDPDKPKVVSHSDIERSSTRRRGREGVVA